MLYESILILYTETKTKKLTSLETPASTFLFDPKYNTTKSIFSMIAADEIVLGQYKKTIRHFTNKFIVHNVHKYHRKQDIGSFKNNKTDCLIFDSCPTFKSAYHKRHCANK